MIQNINMIKCMLARPQSRYRLICFPHAGGTASFFRNWGRALIDFEVYAVCYPGRAERIGEPLPTNLIHLSSDIADIVQPLSHNATIVLFGHSMGAAVALETARSLESRGVKIEHLIVSGSKDGPSPPKCEISAEDDDTLCANLVSLGGTNPKDAADPIFRELVLPSIRGDGQMFHSYEMKLNPTLKCPVTTIFGNIDSHADIRPWRDLAPTGFKEYIVCGDHFYLTQTPPFAILQECINFIDINHDNTEISSQNIDRRKSL